MASHLTQTAAIITPATTSTRLVDILRDKRHARGNDRPADPSSCARGTHRCLSATAGPIKLDLSSGLRSYDGRRRRCRTAGGCLVLAGRSSVSANTAGRAAERPRTSRCCCRRRGVVRRGRPVLGDRRCRPSRVQRCRGCPIVAARPPADGCFLSLQRSDPRARTGHPWVRPWRARWRRTRLPHKPGLFCGEGASRDDCRSRPARRPSACVPENRQRQKFQPDRCGI
jgi:hypothetical protein